MYENVVAVILGGGAGTRLFPLTRERAKPAVPLGGKYRLIDVPVSNCINSNITQMFVLTQFNSASLNRHISRTYRFSNFSTGFVEVLAAEQRSDSPEWFQGTADAVRQMIPHIRDSRVDTVLILSGDHLYRMDYRKFLNRHVMTDADVTISVIPCRREEAAGFGLLKVDAEGRIRQFLEKPSGEALESMRVDASEGGGASGNGAERPFLASMGIYIFKYDKLIELLDQDPPRIDFGGEIIPQAIDRLRVQSHVFDGYWEDIGTIRAFFEANLDLASHLPRFNFFDTSAPIYTRSRYLPPSKLHDCDIDDTMVSEGCILNGVHARQAIIGLRSRIDAGARLERTIVMGSDFYESSEEMARNMGSGLPNAGIGRNTVVKNAIIDKNARIGDNVQLVNREGADDFDAADGSFYIREGIIIVPKNGVIPDGTVI